LNKKMYLNVGFCDFVYGGVLSGLIFGLKMGVVLIYNFRRPKDY